MHATDNEKRKWPKMRTLDGCSDACTTLSSKNILTNLKMDLIDWTDF